MGVDPEEIIHSDRNGIVIEYRDGSVRAQQGNPLELLKAYYDQFQVTKDDGELPFTGDLWARWGMTS